ncbi:hypothetical protein K432DRAFT_265065, partial [Lepidopterella palustris CBS 459.81]
KAAWYASEIGNYYIVKKIGQGALEDRKATLGAEHLKTLNSINSLRLTYRNQGRWKEAEKMDVQVMEMSSRVLGEEHPDTLTSMAHLAHTWKS